MSKNASRESAGDDAQPGRAASYLGWIQDIFCKGFARLGKGRGERRMELLDTLQLGGKRQLLLVLCDGQRYLVGAGGDSVHSIAAMVENLPRIATSSADLESGCRP